MEPALEGRVESNLYDAQRSADANWSGDENLPVANTGTYLTAVNERVAISQLNRGGGRLRTLCLTRRGSVSLRACGTEALEPPVFVPFALALFYGLPQIA